MIINIFKLLQTLMIMLYNSIKPHFEYCNDCENSKKIAHFAFTQPAIHRFFNKEVPSANPLLYNSFSVNVEQFHRNSFRNTEVFHHFRLFLAIQLP